MAIRQFCRFWEPSAFALMIKQRFVCNWVILVSVSLSVVDQSWFFSGKVR